MILVYAISSARMSEQNAQIVLWLPLRDESDIAAARFRTRALCQKLGLGLNAVEALATAVTEVARNVIVHARSGEVLLGTLQDGDLLGVVVIAKDKGPGIVNLADALTDGFSTGTGLGLGLPGARRLVDEFELCSVIGEGTIVTLKQWRRPAAR